MTRTRNHIRFTRKEIVEFLRPNPDELKRRDECLKRMARETPYRMEGLDIVGEIDLDINELN